MARKRTDAMMVDGKIQTFTEYLWKIGKINSLRKKSGNTYEHVTFLLFFHEIVSCKHNRWFYGNSMVKRNEKKLKKECLHFVQFVIYFDSQNGGCLILKKSRNYLHFSKLLFALFINNSFVFRSIIYNVFAS